MSIKDQVAALERMGVELPQIRVVAGEVTSPWHAPSCEHADPYADVPAEVELPAAQWAAQVCSACCRDLAETIGADLLAAAERLADIQARVHRLEAGVTSDGVRPDGAALWLKVVELEAELAAAWAATRRAPAEEPSPRLASVVAALERHLTGIAAQAEDRFDREAWLGVLARRLLVGKGAALRIGSLHGERAKLVRSSWAAWEDRGGRPVDAAARTCARGAHLGLSVDEVEAAFALLDRRQRALVGAGPRVVVALEQMRGGECRDNALASAVTERAAAVVVVDAYRSLGVYSPVEARMLDRLGAVVALERDAASVAVLGAQLEIAAQLWRDTASGLGSRLVGRRWRAAGAEVKLLWEISGELCAERRPGERAARRLRSSWGGSRPQVAVANHWDARGG